MKNILFLFSLFFNIILSEVYFYENFNGDWRSKWVDSTEWKEESDMGKFELTSGQWTGDENHKGIQTKEDLKFYGISSKFQKEFTNENKDLIIQYSVKYEQRIDCGGAYLKKNIIN